MSELWEGLLTLFANILETFHDVAEPLTGVFAWGWAIIMLTLLVRVVLLPLAIKQTKSMRAMQSLQPEIKRIQGKYKADKGLMRSDPEKFRQLRAKQQEEQAALFKERGVNPAASCLPLLAQMPIFFALFRILNSDQYVPELLDARFYLIDPLSVSATSGAGIGAYILIALMGATTYLQQLQMTRSNPAMKDNPQQRVLLYAMPIMLTVFGINFPAGVLLYWVTTNLWTMAQQYFMFRTLGPAPGSGAPAVAASPPVAPKPRGTQDGQQGGADGEAGAKDAQAPKGAPTPKRNEARNRSKNAGGGGGRGAGNPKGRTSARTRQKRG